jgi:hypothetical protein
MSAVHSCAAITILVSLSLTITNKLLFLFYQLCPSFLPLKKIASGKIKLMKAQLASK